MANLVQRQDIEGIAVLTLSRLDKTSGLNLALLCFAVRYPWYESGGRVAM